MATSESPTRDYYEILQCNPSDSIDDIKTSYQQLILKYHPDKQLALSSSRSDQNDAAAGGVTDNELFHRIDTAWKLLRDPEKRKKYDAERQQHRFNDEPIVHAHCTRSDFNFDAETQNYTYPCRCGGFFVLPDEFASSDHSDINKIDGTSAANDEEIYIECDECSFVVRLVHGKR